MSQRGFRSMLAVIDAGFEPAGVVMGAVAMQLLQPMCPYKTAMGTEPLVFEQYEGALRSAWRTAVGRLDNEASKAGAHGVVGISVGSNPSGGLSAQAGVREFKLVGTAVRVPGAAPLLRPFLSMLSMDDTLKLLLRGWVPSGIAIGVSAVHVHGWATVPWRQGGSMRKNMEMEAPTAGMALARDRAEHAARRALRTCHAEGLVAAEVDVTRTEQVGGCDGMLIEGRVAGTGVVRYRDPVADVSAVRNLTGAGRS